MISRTAQCSPLLSTNSRTLDSGEYRVGSAAARVAVRKSSIGPFTHPRKGFSPVPHRALSRIPDRALSRIPDRTPSHGRHYVTPASAFQHHGNLSPVVPCPSGCTLVRVSIRRLLL